MLQIFKTLRLPAIRNVYCHMYTAVQLNTVYTQKSHVHIQPYVHTTKAAVQKLNKTARLAVTAAMEKKGRC